MVIKMEIFIKPLTVVLIGLHSIVFQLLNQEYVYKNNITYSSNIITQQSNKKLGKLVDILGKETNLNQIHHSLKYMMMVVHRRKFNN